MNNKIRKLRQLLAKRKLNCWSCYECCWVILFTKEEKKVMDLHLKKKWIDTPPSGKWKNYCEYLDTDGRCSVYEQRPIVCRMFWQVDHEACKCPKKEFNNLMKHTPDMFQYRNKVLKEGIFNNNSESILWSLWMNSIIENSEVLEQKPKEK